MIGRLQNYAQYGNWAVAIIYVSFLNVFASKCTRQSIKISHVERTTMVFCFLGFISIMKALCAMWGALLLCKIDFFRPMINVSQRTH